MTQFSIERIRALKRQSSPTLESPDKSPAACPAPWEEPHDVEGRNGAAGARLEERKDAGREPCRPFRSRRFSSASHSDHSYSGRAELALEPSSKMESIRRRTWRWLPAANDTAEAKARGERPHYGHGKLKNHKAPQRVARPRNPQSGSGRGRGDGHRGWVDRFRGE